MPGKYNRKDHLYGKAKEEGYRSRAAYKLIEINKKQKLIRPGDAVLDLGCAPGGWLQVVAGIVGTKGSAIGVDIEPVAPFSPAELPKSAAVPQLIQGDIRSEVTRQVLQASVQGSFNVVLSDMSPKLSGIRDRDIARSLELVSLAHEVAGKLLRQGGSLLVKVFASDDTENFATTLESTFRRVERIHPKSSRKTSRELYIAAIGFKGEARAD